jgi:flagellar biosynthesis protein
MKKPFYSRQKAVAVSYNPDEIAPKILAKGAGDVAEKILENAEKSEITIHKDAALVNDLTRLDLGEHIPPELYEAVAQILVFISELDRQERKS